MISDLYKDIKCTESQKLALFKFFILSALFQVKLELMFMKHYAPNRCLYIKVAKLKGTATLMISIFYMKGLSEPRILIPVSLKSVEKYGSYGRLNIFKWTLMEAAIL